MSKHATNHLSKADKKLASIIKRVGTSKLRGRPNEQPFAVLARSIAYQQLAGAAAATIWGRVLELFGGRLPRPQIVAGTDLRKLRRCGLSRAKALAIKDLARKSMKGIVPTRREAEKLSDQELIQRCTEVRGIGPWTVEMFLMFSLGRDDVLPVSDYGVRNGFAILHGLKKLPSPKSLLEHGERWRPYRSHAAWFLWRVVDEAREKKS